MRVQHRTAHRALKRRTPAEAYRAKGKAGPDPELAERHRLARLTEAERAERREREQKVRRVRSERRWNTVRTPAPHPHYDETCAMRPYASVRPAWFLSAVCRHPRSRRQHPPDHQRQGRKVILGPAVRPRPSRPTKHGNGLQIRSFSAREPRAHQTFRRVREQRELGATRRNRHFRLVPAANPISTYRPNVAPSSSPSPAKSRTMTYATC